MTALAGLCLLMPPAVSALLFDAAAPVLTALGVLALAVVLYASRNTPLRRSPDPALP